MIVHLPHASTAIPPACRGDFLLDDRELARELRVSTDHFTDELFDRPDAVRVVFPVSRLVVDPERFADDAQEPMAARGRGVIYTRTVEGKPLRRPPTPGDRARLLAAWYHPHHRALEEAVAAELEREGRALIVDGHSFPCKPWAVELDGHAPRPEYCIGTDPYHTPPELTERLVQLLRSRGHSVAVNHPYAGSIVPTAYYRKDRRVVSIMIEVRRDLYMDETTGQKTDAFETCRQVIAAVMGSMEGNG